MGQNAVILSQSADYEEPPSQNHPGINKRRITVAIVSDQLASGQKRVPEKSGQSGPPLLPYKFQRHPLETNCDDMLICEASGKAVTVIDISPNVPTNFGKKLSMGSPDLHEDFAKKMNIGGESGLNSPAAGPREQLEPFSSVNDKVHGLGNLEELKTSEISPRQTNRFAKISGTSFASKQEHKLPNNPLGSALGNVKQHYSDYGVCSNCSENSEKFGEKILNSKSENSFITLGAKPKLSRDGNNSDNSGDSDALWNDLKNERMLSRTDLGNFLAVAEPRTKRVNFTAGVEQQRGAQIL